jgi:hypothetical protein
MDEQDDIASSFPYHVWGFGIVVPMAVLLYGLYCLETHSAWFITLRNAKTWWELDDRFSAWRLVFVEYQGTSAAGLGCAYICVATYLHLHVFWSIRKRFEPYAEIGKTVAGIGAAGGLLVFIISAVFSAF